MSGSVSETSDSWPEGLWLLRFAAAMCFVGHGAFGILTKAAWVPYFGVTGIPTEWAWKLMPIVGTMDVLLGIVALAWPKPSRWLWAWMAVWAVWTASLRPLSGEPVWETLERAGNYSVPMALFVLAIGGTWFKAAKVLRFGVALLLLGHGMLAVGGKAGLVQHWHLLLPTVDALTMARAAGAIELAMAFFIVMEPTKSLCFTACAWKIATESLFFVAGAPVWEFVERGGSYGAPLVLALWLWRGRLRLRGEMGGDLVTG